MLNLFSEECIIIEFDDVAPIREAQGLLAGFCGILATDNTIFPIGFAKWNDLPELYFNRCFGQIIKNWGARRLKLWDKTFNPLQSRSELMANVPNGISPDQWTSYVDYRLEKKMQKMCKQNAENRKKQTIPHIGGSKSNARRKSKMMAKTRHKPGRAELYLATHKKEGGSYVNEVTKEICVSTLLSNFYRFSWFFLF
ncbi:hypothetical protein P3L10_030868 [Capsicum annuum]